MSDNINFAAMAGLMFRIAFRIKVARWFARSTISLSARDIELLCALRSEVLLRPEGVMAAVFRERPYVLEWINKNVAGRA